MSRLQDYQDSFCNVRFERRDGILQMNLHTDGGPLKWAALEGSVHDQLGEAFFRFTRALRSLSPSSVGCWTSLAPV